ncbi:uncharacterized protein Z520_00383 [Fonsecaea multimorphosa CBS 102226]|uniref:BTB domain-containing protein n=1 Tax=Fonsecaea multimorphosa CBS 102226 TaxID=1442371 RepID=A0A0D2J2M5_9EURO|nr:uncharacterized protein Z520_00383 [Fonsecaea multimorphosa CBS 102226]KIY03692.1 hypothetical protein Z520_00383 [Fonsecaea multimorphosa CBS 102226]OAL32391.1 hypothetical protein AYO22_00413 [Fonsecaea multimorphosa]
MADLDSDYSNFRRRCARVKRKADAMESDGNVQEQRIAELVEVVPDGDVLFQVGRGKGALDIKVSGTVVSLASEVFSRMLSSSFIEGRTKVICLPEDDPKIILNLLKIFHHKYEDVDHLKKTDLLKLITAAEMRLCIPTLKPCVLTRLSSVIGEIDIISLAYWNNIYNAEIWRTQLDNDRMELLYAAVVFRLESLFWKTTRVLIFSEDFLFCVIVRMLAKLKIAVKSHEDMSDAVSIAIPVDNIRMPGKKNSPQGNRTHLPIQQVRVFDASIKASRDYTRNRGIMRANGADDGIQRASRSCKSHQQQRYLEKSEGGSMYPQL